MEELRKNEKDNRNELVKQIKLQFFSRFLSVVVKNPSHESKIEELVNKIWLHSDTAPIKGV